MMNVSSVFLIWSSLAACLLIVSVSASDLENSDANGDAMDISNGDPKVAVLLDAVVEDGVAQMPAKIPTPTLIVPPKRPRRPSLSIDLGKIQQVTDSDCTGCSSASTSVARRQSGDDQPTSPGTYLQMNSQRSQIPTQVPPHARTPANTPNFKAFPETTLKNKCISNYY